MKVFICVVDGKNVAAFFNKEKAVEHLHSCIWLFPGHAYHIEELEVRGKP